MTVEHSTYPDSAVRGAVEQPRPRRRAVLSSRPVVATLVVVLVLIALRLGEALHGATHVAPELERALDAGGRVDVAVTLSFDPEQFHVTYLRERARVARIDGRTFFMRAVEPDTVRRVAGQFWVEDVDVWSDG